MSPYVRWQDRFGFDIDLAKHWHRQGKADAEWYKFAARWAEHMESKATAAGKLGYLYRRRAMEWRALYI